MKILNLVLLCLMSSTLMAHSFHQHKKSKGKEKAHAFHEAKPAVAKKGHVNKRFNRNQFESVGLEGTKKVVLTIDDGPNRNVTDKVLDVLKKYGVQATFFVIGSNASRNKTLMRRIVEEGHLVGNHTYSHRDIGRGSKRKARKEFIRAHETVAPYLRNNRRWYFRAPGAGWRSKLAAYFNKTEIGQRYFGPLLWDIGGSMKKNHRGEYVKAADWACWHKNRATVRECAQGYINQTIKLQGGIILAHDLRSKSADLLNIVIPSLLRRGFEFISLDEMENLPQGN
jgi:peptidoglycan/xylan/chitin deacetylase (PgdA/CDA1 family)